ncbi:MAG: hypothetical protein Kow00109_26720 [Acidobacteriota bacterium]
MTPEEFAKKLREDLGDRVRSIVLYGSAAAGDYLEKGSDFNILVVLDRLGLDELRRLVPACRKWRREGNPPPLLFTAERLARSCDVFPIEILDIQEAHRVLWGEDVVANLPVARENLRHQLEYELKARLIQLRQGYLDVEGKAKPLVQLLVRSLSSILVLARAALRLTGGEAPRDKMEALRRLAAHVDFATRPFETVFRLKEGSLKPREVDAENLFAEYLHSVEQLADGIDRWLETEIGRE